ncbi:predicted protein [Naegleria gruberi]|uniref:Predicted protein n=1 Tax=Naegleria gruberi TaxID=5762 RepID=D2VE92_NAEGR|nr:uncharacterized protein NAEGRDRAFT_67195 [Naegleria gruberi]EFC44841.1 predicted protein [Naegleria gruberi]|eukprot:XP_002677585.1 predicted protein [Naegleria gruberi strain NEG-M]
MVVLANLFSCFFTAPSPNTLTVKKHPAIRLQATTTQTNNSSNSQLELSASTRTKLENASNNNSSGDNESFVKKSRSWRISFRRKSSSPNSDSTALPPLVNESKSKNGPLTLQSSKSTRTLPLQTQSSTITNTSSTARNYARTRSRAKSKSTGSLMTTTQGYTPNVIPAVLKPGQSNQNQTQGAIRKNPKENFKPVGSCSEKSAKLNLSLSTMPPLAVNTSRRRPPGQTSFAFQEHTSQHFSKKHVNETFMDWIQTTDYYAKIEQNLKKK